MNEYFIYQGKRLAKGTCVKFNLDFLGEEYNFHNGFGYYEGGDYFQGYDYLNNMKLKRYRITDTESAIEAITCEKEYVEPEPDPHPEQTYVQVYKDNEVDDMVYAWIVYIAGMLFSTLFQNAIIGWVGFTFFFVLYRHKKLYRTKGKKGGQ